ncbi:jg16051 [Pararge aegeria aegeria]|uniref:Jg16051 protein n=1 Tax=Pararge aegeria aegeria TaxID=348720 RepID=A0A8S4SKK6_9NEOP|nr:jg16051 [Pararge aegeria aegeria]
MAPFLLTAIAFEIPIEEFDSSRKVTTPPPHLQRLLQPPPADIKLPDIREKLAEAEQRRLSILQQRAASAQKRAQRITKSYNEPAKINDPRNGIGILTVGKPRNEALTGRVCTLGLEEAKGWAPHDFLGADESKHGSNVVTISPEPGVCEDKNI